MQEQPPESGPAPEGAPGDPAGEAPSEEELRQRIEEGMRKVRVQDVLLESVVTITNLTARRIAKEDERDLEQARIGIEAVRSTVELLEAEPKAQVRNALSELQMLYARHAGGEGAPAEAGGAAAGEAPAGAPEPSGGEPQPSSPQQREGEGREPPPGLWVPPGSS